MDFSEVTLLIVSHSGPDGWLPVFFRLLFDDGSFVTCLDGNAIDDDAVHTLKCSKPKKSLDRSAEEGSNCEEVSCSVQEGDNVCVSGNGRQGVREININIKL